MEPDFIPQGRLLVRPKPRQRNDVRTGASSGTTRDLCLPWFADRAALLHPFTPLAFLFHIWGSAYSRAPREPDLAIDAAAPREEDWKTAPPSQLPRSRLTKRSIRRVKSRCPTGATQPTSPLSGIQRRTSCSGVVTVSVSLMGSLFVP
jgi:hypothetical protein